MYRAVGFGRVEESGVSLDDHQKIVEIAARSDIELVGEPDALLVNLNGEDVTAEIRTNEIGQAASIVSTVSEVRKFLVEKQRKLRKSRRDTARFSTGRDIGTVVFPNADIKFFSDRQTRSPRTSALS